MVTQSSVPNALQELSDRLREIALQGGDRLAELLEQPLMRTRIDDVADRIDALRREAARYLRDETPLANSFDDLTVDELHELAAKRHIEGRSSMHKQELVEALRRAG
jgi:Rho termination factor, N-terminal domain